MNPAPAELLRRFNNPVKPASIHLRFTLYCVFIQYYPIEAVSTRHSSPDTKSAVLQLSSSPTT